MACRPPAPTIALPRACSWAFALGGLLLTPLPALRAREVAYPSTASWRELQLAVLTCGRENTAASCDPLRSSTDPLLDHPRLPASCKDTLWSIRERAVTAASNSYERREALNRLASDLMVFCPPRSPAKAGGSAGSSGSGSGSSGSSGFGSGTSR